MGYSDMLATYNSIVALGPTKDALGNFYYMDTTDSYSKHGKELFLITPTSSKEFDVNSISINTSPEALGFSVLNQEAKAGFNKNDAVNLFNSYTRVQLTNYLNELAKNPNYTDIVNHEFKEYCCGLSFNSSDKDDISAKADNLMQALASVVEKYGSNSNYEVVEAAIDQPDDAQHTLCTDSLSGKDTAGNVVYQNDFDRLLINVKTYDDNNKCTVKQEVLNNFQMALVQYNYTKEWALGKLSQLN